MRRLFSTTPTTSLVSRTLRAPIQPGQYAETERSFSKEDVAIYARMVLDPNPLHNDSPNQQQRHPLYRRGLQNHDGPIVQGMLVASLFSSIVGTIIPEAVYLTQNVSFRKPVYTDQIVVARIEVESMQGGNMACQTTVRDKLDYSLLVDGEATVWIPNKLR